MSTKLDNIFDDKAERPLQEQLAFVADLTHSFAESLDVRETLQKAGQRFVEYLDAEAASIFLLHEYGDDTAELVCHGCAGPVDINGLKIDAKEGIVGKTVQTQTTQMVRDARLDESFTGGVDSETGFETRSVLCAPLIVRGKCIGALELINKKTGDGMFDEQDKHLTTALASAAALAIRTAQMADDLVEKERIRKELELAREIQMDFLPRQQDEGEEQGVVHGINVPAREVSGDFYDYFTLPDGRIYFNLADVSGKGMNAAMVMAKGCSLLHHLAKTETSPGRLLSRVNDEIAEATTSRGMFITIISGFIDPAKGEIRMANAGHPPALMHRPDGTFEQVPPSAPPIGVMPGLVFPETTIKADGGSLYLFTDGASEALDMVDPHRAVERLKEVVQDKAHLPARERLRNIVSTIGALSGEQRDDITLLLIESGNPIDVH